MPNIGAVLREEITRLSRKESRSERDSTKKATAQHRRNIAELKRQVAQLERQVALLSRKVLTSVPAVSPNSTAAPVRYSAKGVRSQRNRLGLSANAFGKLLGVSAQSIYNWEQGVANPRGEQLAKLVALRAIGKREATARLEQIAAAESSPQPKK